MINPECYFEDEKKQSFFDQEGRLDLIFVCVLIKIIAKSYSSPHGNDYDWLLF